MFLSAIRHPILVFCRFLIAFGMGYLCSNLMSIQFSAWLYPALDKAESVYLAALIALIFYTLFVIFSFCIQSILKLSLLSISLFIILFSLSKFTG
ncbi:hypothetical protein V5M36_07645 [Acinetobacter sp. KS-LM10]|uniref:hypothetical protein n=1 Tax=Acinetobacter sp. KS-LM10 TaxID=3120518 RepID=UPI0030CD6BB7